MIKIHKNKFELTIKNNDESIFTPINTLKLRECLCLKCIVS